MSERTDSPTVLIRERHDTDLPQTAEALVRVHASNGYPVEGVADPQGWLTSPALIKAWVAELDCQIVGHVAISQPQGEDAVTLWLRQSNTSKEHVAVLERLFVLPEARGHAIGQQLTRTATDYAREIGRRLVLDVMTKDDAAIRLYERLGWQPIGTATHTFGDGQQIDAVCYVSPAVN